MRPWLCPECHRQALRLRDSWGRAPGHTHRGYHSECRSIFVCRREHGGRSSFFVPSWDCLANVTWVFFFVDWRPRCHRRGCLSGRAVEYVESRDWTQDDERDWFGSRGRADCLSDGERYRYDS